MRDENNISTSSILKINKDFQIINQIQFDSFSIAVQKIHIADDKIYLFGKNRYKFNELQYRTLDIDLSPISKHLLQTSGEYSFPSFSVLLDHDLYVSYFDEYNDGDIRRTGLARLDDIGEFIWRKTYNAEFKLSYPYEMIYSANDELLVSSSIVYFDKIGRYAQLKKVDQNGIIIWNTIGTEELNHGTGSTYIAELSNNQIVQSYEVDMQGDPEYIANDWNREPTKLVWYDETGVMIYDTTINSPRKEVVIVQNIASGNGDYFFVHGTYETVENDMHYGLLIKLSNDGRVIWSHRYQHPDYILPNANHNITDIIEEENGDIVTLGRIAPSGERSEIWMMRLTEDGCLGGEDCGEVVISNVEDFTGEDTNPQIIISPNPAKDFISISSIGNFTPVRIQIISSNGHKQIESIKDVENINISHLPSGFYIIVLYDENHKRSVQKLLIID